MATHTANILDTFPGRASADVKRSGTARRGRTSHARLLATVLLALSASADSAPQAAPTLVLPMERTAYFVGEQVPVGLDGVDGQVKLEAAGAAGNVTLYGGRPGS